MNRVRQEQSEALVRALSIIPARLRPLVACDVFCEDPLFAGLCRAPYDEEMSACGRSYRHTPHVRFPYHATDGRLSVVLPHPTCVPTVLHEFGHVLHWNLQGRAGGWDRLPRLEPVTRYATTNELEEFAEAFTAWFYPARQVDADPGWLRWSRSNDEFFDRLEVGL